MANPRGQAQPRSFFRLVSNNITLIRLLGGRRVWGKLTRLMLAGLVLPLSTAGQGLRLLGIPLDSLLSVSNPLVNKAYIATYYSRFHLYLVSDRQVYGLHMGEANQMLYYKPNLFWALGAGFDYKWANAQLTIKVPFLSYQSVQKGKTKPFGISLAANTINRRIWFAGQYQSYKGFYLANPSVLEPNWLISHENYPFRADLRSQTVAIHADYMFNPLRVSIPASLLQREGQRKAAGSWVVSSFLTYYQLKADSAFVPVALQDKFAAELAGTGFYSVAFGVSGGYRQHVVFGHGYFLTMSVQPGISVLNEHFNGLASSSPNHLGLGWQGVGVLSVGYSSASYYGGVYGSISLNNRRLGPGLIRTDAEYIRVVVGRRIRYSPKGVLKKVPGLS